MIYKIANRLYILFPFKFNSRLGRKYMSFLYVLLKFFSIFNRFYLNTKNTKNTHLIVSLTSFPGRIRDIHLVIESILCQTVRPAKIKLWLSKEEFSDYSVLPKKLLALRKNGLDIEFVSGNLYPHKKYFYLKEHTSKYNIITIDDDIIYPPKLIENFLEYNMKFNNVILCNRARKIELNNFGFGLYRNFENITGYHPPDKLILPIGYGGVFYPINSIGSQVFDLERIRNYALLTDDLWLKIANFNNGIESMCIGNKYEKGFIPLRKSQNVYRLSKENLEGNNDRVLKKLFEIYLKK
jgi:hypothetical protein